MDESRNNASNWGPQHGRRKPVERLIRLLNIKAVDDEAKVA